MSVAFEDILGKNINIVFILTPLSCDKMDVYKTLIKHSELISKNHRLVTVDKSDNPEQINYDEFAKYQTSYNNMFFFIDNIQFFMYYNIEYYNNTNILIFLLNILDISQIPYIYNREKQKSINLYPNNLCIDIKLEYRKLKTYITGNQLLFYKKEYLKFINDKKENPSKYLNVYFDNIINSLEQASLEQALMRAPKFKTILLEILTKNKKRHLIHLPDNKYGIDAFEVVYNKLNTNIPLIVIKSLFDYNTKIKELAKFNKNNSPAVLLTDYYFTGNNVPKNINMYHITNGGGDEDLISIFDYVKVINKYSKSDKTFEIVNHVASTIKQTLTIDEVNEKEFKEKLDKYTNNYNLLKQKTGKIFVEGNNIKIELLPL